MAALKKQRRQQTNCYYHITHWGLHGTSEETIKTTDRFITTQTKEKDNKQDLSIAEMRRRINDNKF